MSSQPITKILFLAANPNNSSRIRLDEELRDIDEGLRRSQKRDCFVLEQKWAVRPRDLHRAILELNPQIVHFSGHGLGTPTDESSAQGMRDIGAFPESEAGPGGLFFEEDTGQAKLVETKAIASLFALFPEVRCVLLNACYSAVQAQAIAQHIPFVIGMNRAIGDKAAIEFAVGFYDALGAGRSIDFAYKLGCAAIRIAGISEDLIPVLLKKTIPEEIARGICKTDEGLQDPHLGTQIPNLDKVQSSVSIVENLPRSGIVQFVGRQETLQQLHQLLFCHESSVTITAISGMGGIGKTELALQYALFYRHHYIAGICWLQTRGGDIGSQIVQFCRSRLKLNPSEELDLLAQVGFCWTHWLPGNALIVLDDVTNYKAIKPFLPPTNSRFKVLITTRLRLGKSVQQVELNLLSEEASIVLLESLIGKVRVQEELDIARKLLAWLGYLPLGVELVGRYLDRKPDLSLEEMQERLQTKSLNERSLKKLDDDMTARVGVAAAFELSWETLPEAAKQLGGVLSLFALAPISWKLVELCCLESDPEDLEEMRDEILLNLHLLQRKGSGIYQLHQLVREFLRNKLDCLVEPDELSSQFYKAVVAVAQQIPESPTRKIVLKVSLNIPHIAEVATQFCQMLNEQDFAIPFQALGRFYEGQGFYEQAESWAKKFYERAKIRFGLEHRVVATSLDNLAFIYRSRGKFAEAEPLYLQSLEIRMKSLKDDHLEVADSLNNLALLYEAQGRYAEAETLCIQSLEMRKKLLNNEHPEVADSLNNLGLLYANQGKCTEAESLLQEALVLRRRLLSSEHPRIATSLNNLAYCYNTQKKYEEAEPIYIEALELYKRSLGEEHPDVAISLNNLAYLYVSQGRYIEAEPLFTQALEILRRAFGTEHPNIATGLNNLAYIYDIQDRFAEAEPLYQQALEMRKRLLGENHVDVAISLNNLATLCRLQSRYEAAARLYLQAIEILKLQLGDDHPLTVQAKGNLNKLPQVENEAAQSLSSS